MEEADIAQKPKTHKGRKFLQSKEPKLLEDNKSCLFANSNKSNEILKMILSDLVFHLIIQYLSRKDYSKKLGKKNEIKDIFTDAKTIEFLCERNNCAIFSTISHTKKRPMSLIMGNTYEGKILDLFEFEVTNFLPIEYFKVFFL